MPFEPAQELETLVQLDRNFLYVFVSGPGYGEGIVCALPGGGWMTIDSCLAGDQSSPTRWLLNRYRQAGEAVCACVWTHPHEDHSQGLAELIETVVPERVVLALPRPGQRTTTTRAAFAWERERKAVANFLQKESAAHAGNAFRQIGEWMDEHQGTLIGVCAGDLLTLPLTSRVSCLVSAPSRVSLERKLREPGDEVRIRRYANLFSLVLSLEYGQTSVLFGGDLSRKETTVHPDLGWNRVIADYPQIRAYRAQKIAHHGSRKALHRALFRPQSGEPRVLAVTPYNSSKLPSTKTDGGLTYILDRGHVVHLTGLPAQKQLQCAFPPPGTLTKAQLMSLTSTVRDTNPLLDDAQDLRVGPDRATQAKDPIWCFSFDDAGNALGRWRGRAAVEVAP